MNKHLVFVAAGGRGKRLWSALPELRKTNLPKSLGLKINDKPLIAYQLYNLIKLPNCQIVISFYNEKSINVFQQYIREGKIPEFEYLYNLDTYYSKNTTIDIIKSSTPHRPWQSNFETITVTSGDVYFDSEHLANMLRFYKSEACSVQTLCKFEKYMATLKHHFHPVYDKSSKLKYIKQDDKLPKEIINHPQFLIESAFRIYCDTPKRTSKSKFVNEAIRRGEKFMVLKPKEYVNVNFPQDIKKLLTYLT